jgi:hypothetical protein
VPQVWKRFFDNVFQDKEDFSGKVCKINQSSDDPNVNFVNFDLSQYVNVASRCRSMLPKDHDALERAGERNIGVILCLSICLTA